MKRFTLSLVVLCMGLTSSLLTAQVSEPIAETALESDAKQINLHSTTNIPVLQTNTEFVGINPQDGKILWSVKRDGATALLGNGEEEGSRDFEEIPGTPLVFAAGSLINVVTGDVIIDGAEQQLNILRTYYILPEQDLMLMEIGGKGAIYLYGIDPFTNQAKWNVQLREVSGLSQLASEENAGQKEDEIQPQLNAKGSLIYPNGKYLALIDMKSGNLKWNEKFDAGYIFTNKEGSRMVIAEKKGGIPGVGIGAAMKDAGMSNPNAVRKYGKRVHLIDTETGASIWKKEKKMDGNVIYVTPYDGGFLVVHDSGMNIYSYTELKSDGRWKKDYKENGVVNVDKTDKGLMVYTKKKRMLVDPASGDEQWKKAEKLDREPSGFLWSTREDAAPRPLTSVGVHDIDVYRNYFTVVGDEDVRHYFHSILVEPTRVVFTRLYESSGKPQYAITAMDMREDVIKTQAEYFKIKKGMNGFDRTDDGYFVYNDRGYVLLDYSDGDGFKEVKDEWYPDPTAFGRTMLDVAMFAGGAAYTVDQSSKMVQSSVNGDAAAVSKYNQRMNTANDAYTVGDGVNDRQITGRVDNEFAYFFSRDGKDGLTLFKVDKNNGEEISKFRFDDKTPLYEIDYKNNRLYYQADKMLKIYELE